MKMISSVKLTDGLYYIASSHGCSSDKVSLTSSVAKTIPTSALWHFRLGHLFHPRIKLLTTHHPYIHCNMDHICDICHFAKQKRLVFPITKHRAGAPFDLIHVDIWGPLAVASLSKYKFFLTIFDDYTRFVWVIFMQHKSETKTHIESFINMVSTQFNAKIKCIRSDNGPEFLLPQLYASKGIIHQTSCVETPQRNGRVERKTNTS